MARGDGLVDQVQQQNGRKTFVQQISITTSGALTTIALTDVNGNSIAKGATLVLQSDQDFLYEPRNAAALVTAVTATTGARPGIFVPGLSQEFVILQGAGTFGLDTQLDCRAATTSGKLNVYVVR